MLAYISLLRLKREPDLKQIWINNIRGLCFCNTAILIGLGSKEIYVLYVCFLTIRLFELTTCGFASLLFKECVSAAKGCALNAVFFLACLLKAYGTGRSLLNSLCYLLKFYLLLYTQSFLWFCVHAFSLGRLVLK